MHRVKGYLDPVDALAIASIMIAQTGNSLGGGGIAEVGVFFGRSFFLMAKLLEEGEYAFAADLFDIGLRASGESWQLASFLKSAEELNVDMPLEFIFVGSSRTLQPNTLRDKVGPVRFFHIDGDHSWEGVKSDAQLAERTIADFGVICFDDFCNPLYPDVSSGVFDFLRERSGTIAPFLITRKKLFVCRVEYADFYKKAFENNQLLRKVQKTPIELMRSPVLFAGDSQLARLRNEFFVRFGLAPLNGLFY
jgi:hypothetical protein